MKSLTFNSQRKSWLYLLEGRQKAPFAPRNNNLLRVPGMPGAYYKDETIDVLYITQPVGFIVKDDADALAKKDELAEWLLTGKTVELQFDDEPGRTYFAKLEGTIEDFSKFVDQRRGTLTFLCPDPYSYGPEKPFTAPSDYFSITNTGTAEAEPIFEFEVTAPITFLMIQNQLNEYMMIGEPADEDGHQEVVDTRTSVMRETGSTIDDWFDSTSDMVDDYFNDISGEMGTDSAGIRPSSYGTGDKIHGPAITKELPDTLQDFEIETTFDIISRRPEENWRIEVYFHDENMNMLGKIGINDNNRAQLRRVGLGRVGEYRGSGESNGYAIGSHNYSYDNSREVTLMYLRVKREGQRYSFYVAEWLNLRHEKSASGKYLDVKNEFQGQLKYITLFVGKYQDRPSPSRLRINSVEVFALQTVTEDQTPNIAQPGDIITFDHTNNGQVYINGEVYEDNMLGVDYFTLKKGENQLVVLPSDSLNISGRYRERYS